MLVLAGCIRPPYNRHVAVFFHVATYNFPCFQKEHIPLVFHLKYFLFFFANIAKCCVSRMILSVVCTPNFLQTIFLHVVRVLFIAFGICVSSTTGFPVVSIFLAFEALQRRWDVLLNSLKTIAHRHFLGSMGLIKCQDVSVGQYLLLAFSNGDSSNVYDFLFSQGLRYLFFWSLSNSLLLITLLEVLSFSCG